MYDKRSKVGWGVVCAGALVQCNGWTTGGSSVGVQTTIIKAVI